MHAVLIDINSKQHFIFGSPRLRENIGASYQLTLLDGWVDEILKQQGAAYSWVSRSSGKVILTAADEARARDIIREITLRALIETPGMDISGVFAPMGSEHFSPADLLALNRAADEYALRRPPADARFAQLPFLARARDSSLPAAPPLGLHDESNDDKREAHSLPSRVKRHAALAARGHLLDLARTDKGIHDEDEKLARDPTRLEQMLQPEHEDDQDALSKVAVLHIDGNGVGAIMRDLGGAMGRLGAADFRAAVGCAPNDGDALRQFILAVNKSLDHAVKKAFSRAWSDVAGWARQDAEEAGRKYTAIPVVPVLLGGDDVTVITSGDYALPFATSYLRHYEQATAEDGLLKHLGEHPEGRTGPMTAAAGAAIVRCNFPFHIAYDLAERLVEEAKGIGKGSTSTVSTVNYHVLFDTTVLNAEELLEAYRPISSRPFTLARAAGAPAQGLTRNGPWSSACQQVVEFRGSISQNDDDRTKGFPRTRAARIRTMLSGAARARSGSEAGRSSDLLARAAAEWRVACAEYPSAQGLGGKEAMFDLLELADLLPDSYLKHQGAQSPQGRPGRPASDPGEERA